MQNPRPALLLWLVLFLAAPALLSAQVAEKKRVVVLTDIEADPDDTQSLIRFLTYCNQWDVEGFIATTSIHQQTRVAPESILHLLDAYEQAQPNLLKHETGYPAAATLRANVKKGLAVYGMEGVGEGHDSEGSDWIVRLLKEQDSRPIWFTIWGGPNTLAQALWKIKHTLPAAEADNIYKKVRVYTISDQDDSGPWIRKTFPSIFFVVTPGYNYAKATWLGMSFGFPGSNAELVSPDWLAKHIQQGHGPLGAAYPDVAYGMEGDTPSFLNLIDNGLNDAANPNYGGWGGRYELYLPPLQQSNTGPFKRPNWPVDEAETRAIWTNASDSVVSPPDKTAYYSNFATLWRWRADFQNDFAARMQWTTREYKDCNRPPVPRLAHADHLTVHSGEQFRLSAAGTTDPDGDSISYLWFVYPEAGSYKGHVSFAPYAPNLYAIPVTAPVVDKPETIHFILRVTDKGAPPLTRYKRVVVTVLPK